MRIVFKTARDLKLRIGYINNFKSFVRMSGVKGINMGWNGTAVMSLKDRCLMVKKENRAESCVGKNITVSMTSGAPGICDQATWLKRCGLSKYRSRG